MRHHLHFVSFVHGAVELCTNAGRRKGVFKARICAADIQAVDTFQDLELLVPYSERRRRFYAAGLIVSNSLGSLELHVLRSTAKILPYSCKAELNSLPTIVSVNPIVAAGTVNVSLPSGDISSRACGSKFCFFCGGFLDTQGQKDCHKLYLTNEMG